MSESKDQSTVTMNHARWPWLLAAIAVIPTLFFLQRLIFTETIFRNLRGSDLIFMNILSIAFLFGMVTFPIALIAIGSNQSKWRGVNPTKPWYEYHLPIKLLLVAVACNVILAGIIMLLG